MKESKLIEMSNKIDTMGNVLNRIIQELNTMKDISVGTTELVKLLPGYKKALKELINAVLPDVMLKNMGSPALNNRTGRFRNSAQVTNIVVGPRGGTNI